MNEAGPRRILGIDPSFRRTGWAVLERADGRLELIAHGAIPTNIRQTNQGCLRRIQDEVMQVLADHQPDLAVIELPGSWMTREGSSRHSTDMMAMARGVILCACDRRDVPAIEVQFHEVRKALIGSRNAPAHAVLDYARSLPFQLPSLLNGDIDADVANAALMGLYGFRAGVDLAQKSRPSRGSAGVR